MARALLTLVLCVFLVGAGPRTEPAAPQPDAGTLTKPRAFAWDIPRVIGEISVPETFLTNGVPNRMHVVQSALRVQEVWLHVIKSFDRAGLYIPPDKHQLQLYKEPMLTAYDPLTQTSYTVLLHPNANGTTTVVMGEAYIGERSQQDPDELAPVFPGATDAVTMRQESGGSLAYVATTTEKEVLGFYRDHFAKAGYTAIDSTTFQRQDRAIRVFVQPGETRQTLRVLLVATGIATSSTPHVQPR